MDLPSSLPSWGNDSVDNNLNEDSSDESDDEPIRKIRTQAYKVQLA